MLSRYPLVTRLNFTVTAPVLLGVFLSLFGGLSCFIPVLYLTCSLNDLEVNPPIHSRRNEFFQLHCCFECKHNTCRTLDLTLFWIRDSTAYWSMSSVVFLVKKLVLQRDDQLPHQSTDDYPKIGNHI